MAGTTKSIAENRIEEIRAVMERNFMLIYL